ncbi:MAG: hypothetical protein GX935_00085 [Erysipelotrichia bacterium]|nr:hypothetical protein [Erysipelotrichia bacterium]
MLNKIKRKLLIVFSIMIIVCSIPQIINAETTHNVSDATEFLNAVSAINTNAGNHVISLQEDIDLLTVTEAIEFLQGNTTILGNGNKIFNIKGFIVENFGTTLTLGNQAGNTLLIDGSYLGDNPKSLFDLFTNCELNMYEGVTISGRTRDDSSSEGVVISVGRSTFNMYGGSIKDCSHQNAVFSIHPMIRVYNNGEFNMSGGEITNNTVLCNSTSSGTYIYSAAIYVSTSTINLTGGSITKNKIIFSSSEPYGYGAAICAFDSTLKISNMEIKENEISGGNNGRGGAIYARNTNIEIKNSVITRNNVKLSDNIGEGGGIYAEESNLEIYNSLVAFNFASDGAADIYFYSHSGRKLYLPTADAMNLKQATPYTVTITGWYKDAVLDRWNLSDPKAFTPLKNESLSNENWLIAGYADSLYITYDSNGGNKTVYDCGIFSLATIKSAASLGISKEGYDFVSWNASADGDGTTYEVNETLTISEPITLYAQWKPSPVNPETGDIVNPTVFITLMLLSGVGLIVITKKAKKQDNK